MSMSARSPAFQRYVSPLLWQHRWQLAVALTLVGISGAATALQNVYPKWFFSWVLQAPELPAAERWQRLAWLAAAYIVISMVLRMLFWHAGYRLFTNAREKIIFALRGRFFRHVNDLCLQFHGRYPSGELFNYLFGSSLASVMEFFRHATMFTPASIVAVIFTLALFVRWDWPMACVLFLTAGTSVWMMMRSSVLMQRINHDYQSAEGDVSGRVADLLRGYKAVKLYAMESKVAESFETHAGFIAQKSYERDVRGHMEWMKQESITYVCYALLMAACTWRYLGGHVGLDVVAACLMCFFGLTGPLQVIFTAFSLWGGAAAALERIGNVLDTPSSTPDPAEIATPVPAQGELVFDRVSFGYEPGKTVLKDFSLTIRRGERVALVGPSGAGKTTAAQLLLRLYDPQEGAVRLGGQDLRSFCGVELRRQFGVVPQDPFIFQTTIRENVRVARTDASDEAVRRACELANAWEFIAVLPDGLDTVVGEGGATLSGGQRQRIAIARALLADPRFFIFDEATSALDTLSEKLIQAALENNLGDRTVVFIAHRLSTVKNCDRIVVISAGQAVQSGPYDVLAREPGLFRDLVSGQQLRD